MATTIDRTNEETLYRNYKVASENLANAKRPARRVHGAIMAVGIIVSVVLFISSFMAVAVVQMSFLTAASLFNMTLVAVGVILASMAALYIDFRLMIFTMEMADRAYDRMIGDAYREEVKADLAHQEAIGQW